MPMITLLPLGGLANRMRSIASGVSLARKYNSRLRIIWIKDAGLNCAFSELFHKWHLPDIRLKEASLTDRILYDRPRPRNMRIPQYFQRLLFDDRLYDEHKERFIDRAFDYDRWLTENRKVYIATCYPFFDAPDTIYKELFVPTDEIEQLITPYTSQFTAHTVGIHIRRTDNVESIRQSPIGLFIEAMEQEVQAFPDTVFFVASDSEEEKSVLKRRFGKRIITSAQKAERNSIEGMKEAVADFYTLSRTHRIFGSQYSSFSEVAAKINNVPFSTLKLKL